MNQKKYRVAIYKMGFLDGKFLCWDDDIDASKKIMDAQQKRKFLYSKKVLVGGKR